MNVLPLFLLGLYMELDIFIYSRSINETQLIASPKTCLSNFECASSHFCFTTVLLPGEEEDRSPQNAVYNCMKRVEPMNDCTYQVPFYANFRY